MDREIISTRDGSHTVAIPGWEVTYHSVHGAIQESRHVFIEAGIRYRAYRFPEATQPTSIRIFEMGFGTGLNALLSLVETGSLPLSIQYTAIELFPLDSDEVKQLNYCAQLNRPELQPLFERFHHSPWNIDLPITDHFSLHKIKGDLLITPLPSTAFDIIYYDAFAPRAQPDLWSQEVFEKLFDALAPGGILLTYCSKSIVRRAMEAAGFIVEKIPGPLGKREMVRAHKK